MKINKKTAISLFIAFIMIFSVFGLFIDSIRSSNQKVKYNDYKFIQTEQGWQLNYQEKELYFFFTPQMIENIKIDKAIIEKLTKAQTIQITYDGNNTNKEIFAELQYILDNILTNVLKKNAEIGIFNTNITKVITCNDATEDKPVISIEEGENKSIYENNCLRIIGEEETDQLQQIEVLIYQLLGIIKWK